MDGPIVSEMATKIHPHLKSFIHSIVVAEMSGSKPSKWKELLMREVQSSILGRLEEVKSQEDLTRVTKEEVRKVEHDLSLTLGMIRDTIQELPLEILKR
jgi:nitrogen regulatory protein PII-like uncharacterized protein